MSFTPSRHRPPLLLCAGDPALRATSRCSECPPLDHLGLLSVFHTASHSVCRSRHSEPFWSVSGVFLVIVMIFKCIWVLWHTALQKAKVGPVPWPWNVGWTCRVHRGAGVVGWREWLLRLGLWTSGSLVSLRRPSAMPWECSSGLRGPHGGTEAARRHLRPVCQLWEDTSLNQIPQSQPGLRMTAALAGLTSGQSRALTTQAALEFLTHSV